jgi:hypothetical protein
MELSYIIKIEGMMCDEIEDAPSITMSLRPTAPEFKPSTPYSSPALTGKYGNACILSVPELGYEFPYTMTKMPIPITINQLPAKRVWSEMTNTIFWHLRRY